MQIIELHNHSEVVYSIGKMLEYLEVDYSIVANSRVLGDCDSLDCEKIKIADYNRSNKNGLSLFTTVMPDDYDAIQKMSPQKTMGIIHNIHSFFYRKANKLPFTSFPRIKAEIKHFGKPSINPKKSIAALDYISCPSNWMTSLGKKKQSTKWIPPIPFSYCEKVTVPKIDQLTIGVPGTVNARARNYQMLLSAFQKIGPIINVRVRLHFLGSARSRQAKIIQKQFNKLANHNLKIIFDDEYVYQQDYLKKLSEVDFLVIPTQKNYPLGSIYESYGISNMTGSESDMMRYTIPSLWIDHYPLPLPLESISERFGDDRLLADRLIEWINEKKFLSFESARQDVCKHFSIQNQASKLKLSLSQAGVVFP